MRQIEKTVFISYRRTNIPWALTIFKELTSHGYDVFFDYNSIAAGDFEQVILGNIRARAHFLVLLTPSALERCQEPRDWLRREIETALAERRNIVPLMLEGFDFATPGIGEQLTGKLAPLKQYNALRVPADYFDAAMTRLREQYLNLPLETVLHPLNATVNAATQRHQAAATAAPAVAEKVLSAQEWFEVGFNATDTEHKISYYKRSLELNPSDVLAHHIQGVIYAAQGDHKAAIEAYTKAIEFEPSYFIAYYNRGLACYDQGDLARALADYDAALRLNPDYAYTTIMRRAVTVALRASASASR